MDNQFPLAEYSKEFSERVSKFREEWYQFYSDISHLETPAVDGTGKKIIQKRPDGYDYIEETFMRESLDRHFTGWSWEMASPLHFLGSEWIVAQGHLIIIDEHLLAFGISPPIRKFYGADSVRIQYRRNTPHTVDNIVDVGDNAKQAITSALKYAINRLTRIGDDVYGKRLEMEGAGTMEQIIEMENAPVDLLKTAFNEFVQSKHMTWKKVFEILEIKGMNDIKDFKQAYNKIKEWKKGGDVN